MDMQSFLDDLIKTGREYAEQGQKMAEDKLNGILHSPVDTSF